jgi:hypothetical protein
MSWTWQLKQYIVEMSAYGRRRNLHLQQNEHDSAAGRSWDPKMTSVRSDSLEVGIWRPEASGEKQICMTNSAPSQKDYTNCKDSKGVRDSPNTIAHVPGESFANNGAQLKVGESCARNPPHLDYNTDTKVMDDKYHLSKPWEHEQINAQRPSSGPGPSQVNLRIQTHGLCVSNIRQPILFLF